MRDRNNCVNNYFLDHSSIDDIHNASLSILRDVGVQIGQKHIRDQLVNAGANSFGTEGVKFPKKMVEEYISLPPSEVKIGSVEGDVQEIGEQGDSIYWTGAAINIVENKACKEISVKDLSNISRLVSKLVNVDAVVGTSIQEFPPRVRDFIGFRVMATNTSKHIRPLIFSPRGASPILEMAKVLIGRDKLEDNPVFSLGYSIENPLQWPEEPLETFSRSTGYKIPVMVNAEPTAGATSPVTLAGTLAQANSEVLSGIIINQVLEAGRPCIYNIGFAHPMDMRSAKVLTGSPENAIIAGCGAELAQFYGLPSASWMCTEAFTESLQAATEKTINGLSHSMSGVDIIWGMGQLESQKSISLQQLVIDDEMIGMVKRLKRGLKVNEETIALDLIKSHDHEGDFLSETHTMEHFKKEIFETKIFPRITREEWGDADKQEKDIACERVDELLSEDKDSHLKPTQVKEIKKIEDKWKSKIL